MKFVWDDEIIGKTEKHLDYKEIYDRIKSFADDWNENSRY